jgi:uncharacterized phiE125 gp8 family phage protein
MFHRLTRVSAPASAAVSLAEARAHLRVGHSEEDNYIERLVSAATARIDGPDGIGFCMMPQTWALSADKFESRVVLPLRPIVSVLSIGYLDADGVAQTVPAETYRLAKSGGAGIVEVVKGAAWPSVGAYAFPVTITFVAGTGAPPALQHAILLMVADLYENRDGQTERPLLSNPVVADLVSPYRGGWVAA